MTDFFQGMKKTFTKNAMRFIGVDKNTRPVSYWLNEDEQDILSEDDDGQQNEGHEMSSVEEDLPLWLHDEYWQINIKEDDLNPPDYIREMEEEGREKKYMKSVDITYLEHSNTDEWRGKGKGRGVGQGLGEIERTGNARILLDNVPAAQNIEQYNDENINAINEGRPKKAAILGKNKPNRAVHTPYFIIGISITHLLLLCYSILVNGGFETPASNPFIGVSSETLIYIGGKWSPYILDRGEWWRFFVPIYLHSGIVHLALNLLSQIGMGWKLEKQHGTFRIIPIYFLSGLFGNLLSCIFLPQTVSVGASGAIFGFFGILLIDLFKNWKKLKSPWKNLIIFAVSMIISLALGILPLIDNFQHVGGFLMGIVAGVVFLPSIHFGKKDVKKRILQVAIATPVLLFLTIGAFVIVYKRIPPDWCPGCYAIDCVEIFNWKCSSQN